MHSFQKLVADLLPNLLCLQVCRLFTCLSGAFTRFLQLPKQHTKQNTINFQRPFGGLWRSLWSDSLFGGGLLKYPGPFFAGRRTDFVLFFFSLKKSIQNWTAFSTVRGERKCSTRFGTAKSYFCNEPFQRNRPMATAPNTKAKDKTQDAFVFSPKSPNQRAV